MKTVYLVYVESGCSYSDDDQYNVEAVCLTKQTALKVLEDILGKYSIPKPKGYISEEEVIG
jgi:hypothetical protein